MLLGGIVPGTYILVQNTTSPPTPSLKNLFSLPVICRYLLLMYSLCLHFPPFYLYFILLLSFCLFYLSSYFFYHMFHLFLFPSCFFPQMAFSDIFLCISQYMYSWVKIKIMLFARGVPRHFLIFSCVFPSTCTPELRSKLCCLPGAYLGFCRGGCTFLADLPHKQPFSLGGGGWCTGRGGCTCILCIPPGYAPVVCHYRHILWCFDIYKYVYFYLVLNLSISDKPTYFLVMVKGTVWFFNSYCPFSEVF